MNQFNWWSHETKWLTLNVEKFSWPIIVTYLLFYQCIVYTLSTNVSSVYFSTNLSSIYFSRILSTDQEYVISYNATFRKCTILILKSIIFTINDEKCANKLCNGKKYWEWQREESFQNIDGFFLEEFFLELEACQPGNHDKWQAGFYGHCFLFFSFLSLFYCLLELQHWASRVERFFCEEERERNRNKARRKEKK